VSRGQVSKSNEHTNIVHEVLCLKILRVTQKGGSNLSWEAWIGVKLERERERGFELKKGCFKVFSKQ
jgi:hypothetical protein